MSHPHHRSLGLSQALYEEIRARMVDGTYAVGAPMPSTRALAAERGLSRATVTLVYEQLAADGFIETRLGAASRVASGAAAMADSKREAIPAAMLTHPATPLSAIGQRIAALGLAVPSLKEGAGEIDFVYGPLSGSDFPTLAWMKALRVVERQRGGRLEYDDPRGSIELRRALQAHLSRARGLACSAEQIIIVSGSQQALDLCARLLVDPGETVVVENPGYRMAHHAFEAYGARLRFLGIDEQGATTDTLDSLGAAKLAYVTWWPPAWCPRTSRPRPLR